ncbi:MAG TPA: DUF4159 domain-containing protein [Vicinamibacterales bacterium]|nr:DUF4159 domain-containing protein [Vicinamibacterales bacterium]
MKRTLLVAALVLCVASAAAAQFGRFGGFGFRNRFPPHPPTKDTFGHGFNFCRGIYTSNRGEAGGTGWTTDYPDADINFSIRLSELTKIRVKFDAQQKPDFVTVRLTDDALFQCPFVHMEDVGTMELSDAEVEALRAYLLKGGFVWVDDFWGPLAWEQWTEEIGRVLPSTQYPIRDLTPEHPIYKAQFVIKEFPQIPSIQHWRGNPYSTSERGEDSATPEFKAISDSHDRIMVLMTHNTDISDAWEREGEDPRYFYQFSPKGYAVGINAMVYTMTH